MEYGILGIPLLLKGILLIGLVEVGRLTLYEGYHSLGFFILSLLPDYGYNVTLEFCCLDFLVMKYCTLNYELRKPCVPEVELVGIF